MYIYATRGPQERLALRKSEKIAKSEMFSYYVEEAQKITETEIKNSEHRRHAKESSDRNDLSTPLKDMLWDRYLDEVFENNGFFGGLSFNHNFLNFLSKNSSKNSNDELLGILSNKKPADDGDPKE